MTETAAINFGPAWLRDTFAPPSSGGGGGGGGPEHAGSGGGGPTGGKMAPMAPAKLAEFRYGREEILALFEMNADLTLPSYQEKVVSQAGLLAEKPLLPLALMGANEDEQRAWQRGANSDTSLRLYKKDIPSASMGPGGLGGGPGGVGRGGPVERGRGRGRGFFDRHRAPPEDDEGIGRRDDGRPFGRGGPRSFDRSLSERGGGIGGGWYDRSNSVGGPPGGGEDGGLSNGSISPRKGYSRAPYDDWRKPSSGGGTGTGNDEEEWTTTGGGYRGSGRRWNAPPGSLESGGGRGGGWRTAGEREYVNGNSRWNDDGGYRRGGFGTGRGFSRSRSRQDSDIPEWATEEVNTAGGGFDSSGKFSLENKGGKRVITLNRDVSGKDTGGAGDGASAAAAPGSNPKAANDNDKHDDDNAFEDEEEVDVDDLPDDLRKTELDQRQGKAGENSKPSNGQLASVEDSLRLEDNDDMANDFVSKLIDEDEPVQVPARKHQQDDPPPPPPPPVEPQQPQQPPAPSQQQQQQQQQPHQQQQQQPPNQIPSVQQIQWYYLDPQGNEQGPFSASDMLEWFEAGYFPADLMLRRAGIDQRYAPLGEMSRRYGRVPFTPGPAPGPFTHHQEQQQQQQQPQPQHPAPQQTPTPPPPSQQQQVSPQMANSDPQQQQLLMQQMLLQQQQQQQQQMIRQQQQQHLLALQHAHPELDRQQLINLMMQKMSIGPQASVASQVMPGQQQQQPKPSASATDISMLMKQQQQQQQQQQVGAGFNLGLPGAVMKPGMPEGPNQQMSGMNPMMTSSSAESGLQLLGGGMNKQAHPEANAAGFNPIRSLLSQLQQHQEEHEHQQQPNRVPASASPPQQQQQQQLHQGRHQFAHQQQHQQQPQEISPSPPPLQAQSPPVSRSIWGDSNQPHEPKIPQGIWEDSPSRESPSFYNQVQHQREKGHQQQQQQQMHHKQQKQQQHQELDDGGAQAGEDFVKPKSSEKKDKKMKRAEEKKRAREAKKAAAANSSADYIPGMEGSVRPQSHDQGDNYEDQHVVDDDNQEPVYPVPASAAAAATPPVQPKLAPWAKSKVESPINGNESGMSLAEIQKLEEERERAARLRREAQEAMAARIREEEARRQQAMGHSWANAAGPGSGSGGGAGAGHKSLAEIQAEEARQERERQEREKKEKRARQKELNLSQASVWGSASANLSWASKAQQPQQQQQQSSAGFWESDPQPSHHQHHHQQQQQHGHGGSGGGANSNKQSNKSNKKGGSAKAKAEENKVAAIFKETKARPANEFEAWCASALEKLNPQVDIPTFMTFLRDVDSPYEVNDYVKNYFGDGKGPKNFAKEYLERRSKWRNSQKAIRKHEDDLLTPAAAINPNDPNDEVANSAPMGGNAAGGAAKSKNKKKNKSKSKLDASHLLGFSVASADRPNAGELDLPQ